MGMNLLEMDTKTMAMKMGMNLLEMDTKTMAMKTVTTIVMKMVTTVAEMDTIAMKTVMTVAEMDTIAMKTVMTVTEMETIMRQIMMRIMMNCRLQILKIQKDNRRLGKNLTCASCHITVVINSSLGCVLHTFFLLHTMELDI